MKYQYVPLSIQTGDPSGLFAIRLLHVLPSRDCNSTIQCRLVETLIPDYRKSLRSKLQVATHVDYHALSYTWGDPIFPRTLQILNKSTEVGKINITENLHSALQNLRLQDRIQILWVDAVCIDQNNIPERNSQVSNIPQTYSQAVDVLVWLGAESLLNDGSLCLKFFTDLACRISNQVLVPGPFDHDGSWRHRLKIYEMVTSFLNSSESHLVPIFLSRTWFRRRWIVQEVVLARNVKLYCGTSSISWIMFQTALTELFNHHRDGFRQAHRTTLRTMSRIRDANSGAKVQTPLDTLVEFSEFLCSDPRDRLYALYGVIQHWLPASTTETQTGAIDCSLSIAEVYTNFAILMMHLNQSNQNAREYNSHTHILQLAAAVKHGICHMEASFFRDISDVIPSWVPDWTGRLSYKPLKHSPLDRDASHAIEARPIEILALHNGSKCLLVTGVMYDIVTASITIDIGPLIGSSDESKKKELNRFLSAVDLKCQEIGFFHDMEHNNYYLPTLEHFIAALAITIVANWEHTPENSYFAQNSQFPQHFLDELRRSNYFLPEILHKWPAYVDVIAETMRGRTFFLTQGGYMGIGNEALQANDIVCILSGTRIPFILRSLNGSIVSLNGGRVVIDGCREFEGEDKQEAYIQAITEDPSNYCMFQLLGDAYLHGLMDGNGNWSKTGSSGQVGGPHCQICLSYNKEVCAYELSAHCLCLTSHNDRLCNP